MANAMEPDPPRPGAVRTTQQARQATTANTTRYVLGFGLALVIVAFIAVYLLVF